MPLASTEAFILGNTPTGEQDRLVYLLTEEKGILKAIAPGSLKSKNRFGSLFELFTEGEFHYYWQENRDHITISKGEIIHSYFNVVSNPKSIFYFYLISDVLLKFIPRSNKDTRLYRLLNTILLHCEMGVAPDLLLLYFLLWVLRIEGMMFKPYICYNCYTRNMPKAWFRTDYRGILCEKCRTDEKYSLEGIELQFIYWTEKNPPKDLEIWTNEIDIPKLIRSFTKKIEYHGECSLISTQYLSEFR